MPVGSPRMMPTPKLPLSVPRTPSSAAATAGATIGAATPIATARAKAERMRQPSPTVGASANSLPGQCRHARPRPARRRTRIPAGAPSRLEQARQLVAADPELARGGRLVAVAALEDRAGIAPLGLVEHEVAGQPHGVVVVGGDRRRRRARLEAQ